MMKFINLEDEACYSKIVVELSTNFLNRSSDELVIQEEGTTLIFSSPSISDE